MKEENCLPAIFDLGTIVPEPKGRDVDGSLTKVPSITVSFAR